MAEPAPPRSSAAPWRRLAITLLLAPAIVLAPTITLVSPRGTAARSRCWARICSHAGS